MKFVQEIDDWEHGIKFAQWKNKNVPKQKFPSGWVNLLEELLNPGCNTVDVGAGSGSATLAMAHASQGGTTIAVELAPVYELLKINSKLNPHLDIHTYNNVVTNVSGTVRYSTECEGCSRKGMSLPSLLSSHYPPSFISKICLVRLDAGSYNTAILSSLNTPNELFSLEQDYPSLEGLASLSPNQIWLASIYWPQGSAGKCSSEAEMVFSQADRLGYKLFHPSTPFTEIRTCMEEYLEDGLLLIRMDILF